jgi:septal ring factor EnvC (AmiA/AmiB activator)
MTRLMALVSACVLACATVMAAQSTPTRPPARGGAGNPPGNAPTTGRATMTPETRAELQRLREDLKKNQDEAKRLQIAIQADKKAGDKAALKRDTESLAQVRKDINKDQDQIKALQQQNGRGGV